MSDRKLSERTLILIALAAFGLLLVYLPPKMVEQYDRVKSIGPPWTYFYLGLVSTGAVILLSIVISIGWKLWRATRVKEARRRQGNKNPSQLTATEQQQELAGNLATAADLQAGTELPPEIKSHLQALAARVEEKRASQKLEIVAFGTISSGKSSLLNSLADRDAFQTDLRGGTTQERLEIPWQGDDRVTLVDTPGLGEIEGHERVAVAALAAKEADVVLLVVDGPLRDSEFQLLKNLVAMEKRVLICLNKSDWYSDEQRQLLIGQILEQIGGIVVPEDVLAVRAQPTQRTRVHLPSAGTEREELVPVPADISPLARRLVEVVRETGQGLLMANLLLRSRGLVEDAKRHVQETLDAQALAIVDRYTWACGATAALSPMPVLDLFATSALTTKMVVDLARAYRQDLDLNTAVTLLGQLGKNLIAILGINAAAPAAAAAIASLLKAIPLAGTLVGGALQGIVQALVTRWIGLVFIRYFQADMKLPAEGLANVARQEWQRLTSPAELVKFVQQARDRFRNKTAD